MRRLSILTIAMLALLAVPAVAGHNGAEVTVHGGECDATQFVVAIVDPDGTHQVNNMRLVVDDGSDVRVSDAVPTDGSTVTVTVGPYTQATEVLWRIFGGGERDYDQPLWHGYGEPGFTDDINDYAAQVGGFGWVVSGFDDPNPFTTWNALTVDGCAPEDSGNRDSDRDVCKDGGWQDLGFRNQGQCIRFVNTGKDSR